MRIVTTTLIATMLAGPLAAEGDPTRRATRLEPLHLDAVAGFSVRRYELEAGTYYRWRIEADGREEYELVAPDFFPEIWLDRVDVEEMSVRVSGLRAVELGDAGTIDLWFVPIRAGNYSFEVEGLEGEEFKGEIVVK